MRSFKSLLCLILLGSIGEAQELPWQINPRPTLVLGDANRDANVLFGAGLIGATRLPDGRILVGDRGAYSLKLFAPDGKHLKNLGRTGEGPGEFAYLAKMFRCGDQIITYDIEGAKMSVFDMDVTFNHTFRFASPELTVPYASACNASRTFVHYGWGPRKGPKPGIHRDSTALWTTGADSAIRRRLGFIPGSERWGHEHGSRPLPLGKQSVVAISADRIFVGTADTYAIVVYDTLGRRVGTIRKTGVNLAVTKADIDLALEREIAGQSERQQKATTTEYAIIQFPKTIPAYIRILTDSDGLLWVQDYPRTNSTSSRWTLFTPAGAQRAEVMLPAHLDVYEVGKDYVLGKYIDPDEQIPEIRMYKLRRDK